MQTYNNDKQSKKIKHLFRGTESNRPWKVEHHSCHASVHTLHVKEQVGYLMIHDGNTISGNVEMFVKKINIRTAKVLATNKMQLFSFCLEEKSFYKCFDSGHEQQP